MSSIYLPFVSDSACPYNRFLLPARFSGPDCAQQIDVGPYVLPDIGYDWIGFHSIPDKSTLFEIQKRRNRGVKFLWSLDDDWTSIPDWNPAKLGEDGEAVFAIACQMADAVLCSTEKLAEVMGKEVNFQCEVYHAPNLIDLTEFPPAPERMPDGSYNVLSRLPVRILWSGSNTHNGDVEQLIAPLDALLTRLSPEEVQVVWMGSMPPPLLLKKHLHRGLTYQPMVSFETYRRVVASIRPDVILAPLAPIPFNESKSYLRIMEAWGMTAVPIASDFGPYKTIRQNVDGVKVGDLYEWDEMLDEVCRNHQYRLRMAVSGRLRAEAECDWNNPKCRVQWNEFWNSLLGG